MALTLGFLVQHLGVPPNPASDRPSWLPPNDVPGRHRSPSAAPLPGAKRRPSRVERHAVLSCPPEQLQLPLAAAGETCANWTRLKPDTARRHARKSRPVSFSVDPDADN